MARAPNSKALAALWMTREAVYIGTAGWSIPRSSQIHFPDGPSHLERYASTLAAVEINSTFYKPHRAATLSRWYATVPAGFRFSVKLSKTITHEKRLVGAVELLDEFLLAVGPLGDKLSCLLVQLPPSLQFDPAVADTFFGALRERFEPGIALEPRHASWFDASADEMLVTYQIARVAADPARVPAAALPGGWPGLVYYRWHGSPRVYYSSYDPGSLAALAERLNDARRSNRAAWCIFDNTASGAAMENALELRRLVGAPDGRR